MHQQTPSRARERSTPSYVPALDGLRGVAIAGVVLFHTGYLSGGFLGVDLFFVLSGFLITGLLMREAADTGRVHLVRFWARRLRRLFPALALMMGGTALTVWALERTRIAPWGSGLVNTTLSDGFWAQLNLVNWHLIAEDASYWDAFGQSRVFEHLWSIAVEEQFYLVWPLMIGLVVVVTALGRRHWRTHVDGAVIVIAGVLAVASCIVMIVAVVPADPTRVYTGTDTRAFSLLIGAAAVTAPVRRVCVRSVSAHPRVVTGVIGALGAGLVVAWIAADGTSTPGLFTGGLLIHAVTCAALIALIATVTQQHVRKADGTERLPASVRMFQNRQLMWLGKISYSLYLWHWPVITLVPTPDDSETGMLLHAALVSGVSLVAAAASRYFVEDPIRFRARWARGRIGLGVFLAVSILLLALWALLPQTESTAIDVSVL
ncbi:acyltransferase family protein [Paramicrobacterium chengjingii]|uniref:Acyltransferase n=1 Tax=Paramicrobacterium chengjingii TaxID=2769067 RepID=A0ABX6YKY6_9MICO|nr:acyltransferase [Microbacterium chengjingii]QPZ39441.1 acyltransferase [Microbacterium chengjingii]